MLQSVQIVSSDIRGDDRDEAMTLLPGLYAGTSWRTGATAGDYSYRYLGAGTEEVSLRRSRMSGFLHGDVQPGDEYVVQWIDAGSAVLDLQGGPTPMVPGRPELVPPDRSVLFRFTDYEQTLVHLGRSTVAAVAAERYAFPGPAPRLQAHASSGPPALLWRRAVADLARTLHEPCPTPLTWSETVRGTAVAFLRLFPPQHPRHEPGRPTAGSMRIRSARDYLEMHADEPVTVTDLALAVGMSVRGVQAAFQRTLGTSPLQYLRDVRLQRVRSDLLRLSPAPGTVDAVARRWGFTHLGRFARAYAERFGEHPRDSLGR